MSFCVFQAFFCSVEFSLCNKRSNRVLQKRRSVVSKSRALIIKLALIAMTAGDATKDKGERRAQGSRNWEGIAAPSSTCPEVLCLKL